MREFDWDILRDHIENGKSIIDVGCGYGYIAKEFLKSKTGKILGVDRIEECFNECSLIDPARFRVVKSIDGIEEKFDYCFYFGLQFAPQYEFDFLPWISTHCSILFTHTSKPNNREGYNEEYGEILRKIYKNVEIIGYDELGGRSVYKCC